MSFNTSDGAQVPGEIVYGGKLRDLSETKTQRLTILVLRLCSGLEASGMGEKGLRATRTATAFAPIGELACRIW
jgi:hypothetical protein